MPPNLEEAGVVARRELRPPVSATVYELTEIGRELERPMIELGRWGMHFYSLEEASQVNAWTLPNALRIILQPPAEIEMTLGLRCDGQAFKLRLAQGWITGERAEPDDADLVLSGEAAAILACVAHGEDGGEVQVDGDADLLAQIRGMVQLPPHLRAEMAAASTARSA